MRGVVPVSFGQIDCKVGAFRTDSENDIIHVASFIQGRGVLHQRRGHAPPGPGGGRAVEGADAG